MNLKDHEAMAEIMEKLNKPDNPYHDITCVRLSEYLDKVDTEQALRNWNLSIKGKLEDFKFFKPDNWLKKCGVEIE